MDKEKAVVLFDEQKIRTYWDNEKELASSRWKNA